MLKPKKKPVIPANRAVVRAAPKKIAAAAAAGKISKPAPVPGAKYDSTRYPVRAASIAPQARIPAKAKRAALKRGR
jgi:hypothetical protein